MCKRLGTKSTETNEKLWQKIRPAAGMRQMICGSSEAREKLTADVIQNMEQVEL